MDYANLALKNAVGMEAAEVAEAALSRLQAYPRCLIVLNTIAAVERVYDALGQSNPGLQTYCFTTNLSLKSSAAS